VGPLPASSLGHTHLFTVVDRSTRWPEAIPLAGTTTADCVEAFLSGWVNRFGVPANLRQGCAIHLICVERPLSEAGDQPQAHHSISPAGQWISRTFSQTTEGGTAGKTGDWYSQLPWVMMGLRAAPKEDCGLSSAELVYGEPLTLPGEFLEGVERPPPDFTQQLRQQMSAFQPPATRPQPQQPTSAVLSSLMQAQFVYIKRGPAASSLSPLYAGPYKVVPNS
jgi:hypothetical protein